MINIAIVEDHKLLAQTLSITLNETQIVNVVSVSHNASDFLETIEKVQVDIVLLDINLPDIDGITLCGIIKKTYPLIKVIGFSSHDSKVYFGDMLSKGANGYVLKDDGIEELKNAILAVNQSFSYYSQGIFSLILKNKQASVTGQNQEIKLSSRQKEIAKLISKGATTKDIASILKISEATISTHRNNIMKKLNVHNIAGIISYVNNNSYS